MSRSLLVITSSFPRGEFDVAGHFVEQWCRALADRGWTIDVLCWRGPNAEDRQVSPGLKVRFVPYAWPGAERLFFGAGAPENLHRRPRRALLGVPAVAAMVSAALAACRRREYDRIAGHWLVPGGLIARSVAALTGIESAVVGHSGGVHLLGGLPPVVRRPLVRWITAGATTVPTEPLRSRLREFGGRGDIEVAPMGYAPPPEKKRLPPADGASTEVGFLGRLVPIKGVATLLRAVERVRRRGGDLELTVVGDGPCRRRWEDEAGDGVQFVGAKYGREKWAYLRRWQALAVPSKRTENGRHEGLPVSLLEGASAGAVPFVSGVPGVASWLAKPSEQVLPAGDVDAWSKALAHMADLERERRVRLRRRTRQLVAPLAWPRYGRWWHQWLSATATAPWRKTS